jgi:hypothetical protein
MLTCPDAIDDDGSVPLLCEQQVIQAVCHGQKYLLRVRGPGGSAALDHPFLWNGDRLALFDVETDLDWKSAKAKADDILCWFAEEYPHSCLLTGHMSWRIEWPKSFRRYWKTDNESAAVMMRMRWS